MSQSNIVKQDVNFLENPLWVTDCRYDKRHKFEITLPGGKYIYEAAPDDIPDDNDALFLYYLLFHSQKSGKTNLTVGIYRTLKDLDFPINSKSYKRFQKSLDRWGKVYVKFEGSFYTVKKFKSKKNGKEVEERVTKKTNKSFHILKYEDERTSTERIIKNEKKIIKSGNLQIKLDPDFIEVIEDSNFIKYIDLNVFIALKKPLDRRLYEWLPKQFISSNICKIGAVKFFDKVRINDNPYPSVIKRRFKTINGAIEKINKFDKKYSYRVELKNPQKKVFNFVFKREKKKKEVHSLLNHPERKEKDGLFKYLTETWKISASDVEKFIKDHTAAEITDALDAANEHAEREKKKGKTIQTLGGLAKEAIRGQWKPSIPFAEKAGKRGKKKLAQQAERAKAKKEAEEKIEEEKKRQELINLFKAKPDKEQKQLLEQFRKNLESDRVMQGCFDRGGFESVVVKGTFCRFLERA